MKRIATFLLFAMVLSICGVAVVAQQSSFRVTRISPYDRGVAGQILSLEVEGLEGGAWPLILQTRDFSLTVSQDGISQEAKIRSVNATLKSEPRPRTSDAPVERKMIPYQTVGFIVPAGLHPGKAELILTYKGQRGNAIGLDILEKPMAPIVGSVAVMTITSSALPPPPAKIQGNDLGWRLERGTSAQVQVQPLTDPDDPNAVVVVRFKQNDTYYDAQTRVTNQPQSVEQQGRRVGFFPARDALEVDVPAELSAGPAEVEIRIRANGKESEPSRVKATITDAVGSVDTSPMNAPRLLLASPLRIGAGQSLMLSVDYRRTLNPDPSKTVVAIEQGNMRYIVPIERSSIKFGPQNADAPVLFFVRTTQQIMGKAQIRIFNQLRSEPSGLSNPIAIEIVNEPVAPQLIEARQSTEADLAPMRQRYEMQKAAGGKVPVWDPSAKFVTLHIKGLDYNPKYVQITFEQSGNTYTLNPMYLSSYSEDRLIVRQPKELKPGAAKIVIQNRGIDSLSTPVSATVEICCTP